MSKTWSYVCADWRRVDVGAPRTTRTRGARTHLVELGYTSIPVSDGALCQRDRERVLGCTARSRAGCQCEPVVSLNRGRPTFKELAAVSLTGFEFDRDDVTERLVQELDGHTLLKLHSGRDEVERAVQRRARRRPGGNNR